MAVRPALHLNLTNAENASVFAVDAQDINTEYNGNKQTIDTLVNWYDPSATILTEVDGNFTDVGAHTVKVTLTDADYVFIGEEMSVREKEIKINITKKKILMQAPSVD